MTVSQITWSSVWSRLNCFANNNISFVCKFCGGKCPDASALDPQLGSWHQDEVIITDEFFLICIS